MNGLIHIDGNMPIRRARLAGGYATTDAAMLAIRDVYPDAVLSPAWTVTSGVHLVATLWRSQPCSTDVTGRPLPLGSCLPRVSA